MNILVPIRVSDHAVKQFRERIAAVGEERARFFIREGIRRSTNIKLLPDGGTLRVRTRRPFPFEFRAICVLDESRGGWVVATILRGDGSITRKRRRRAADAVRTALKSNHEEAACETTRTTPNPS